MRAKSKEEEEDREPLLTMSKTEADPFYSVRDNVNNQIEKIRIKHDKFQDLLKNSDTSASTEFKDIRKTIVKDIRAVEKDLKGLKGAVDMVDKNRAKFQNIKDSELASRKKFVEDSQNIITEVKTSIDSQAVRRKVEDDDRKSKRDSYDEASSALHPNPAAAENSRFIKSQKQQTQEMIERQDQGLEELGRGVDRLHELGKTINEEVKDQSTLLDHLGNEVDDASSRMTTVQGALEKLLKTKDGCQIWTIVILGVVLIILVCLVIWVP